MVLLVVYFIGFLTIFGVAFGAMVGDWNDRVISWCITVAFVWVILGFALYIYTRSDELATNQCIAAKQSSRDC